MPKRKTIQLKTWPQVVEEILSTPPDPEESANANKTLFDYADEVGCPEVTKGMMSLYGLDREGRPIDVNTPGTD